MQIGKGMPELNRKVTSEFRHLGVRGRAEVSPLGKNECNNPLRLPIALTLRKLGKGEVVCFPIEQRTSVMTTVNRLRKELSRIGWNCLVEDDEGNYSVKLTRTH